MDWSEGVLRIRVNPSKSSREDDLKFTWNVVNMTKRELVLKFNFTNPKMISAYVNYFP